MSGERSGLRLVCLERARVRLPERLLHVHERLSARLLLSDHVRRAWLPLHHRRRRVWKHLNNCRVCPAGQTCEVDRTCGPTTDGGCVPRACPSTACGVIDDGCGGRIDCGGCYWACETGSGSGSGPSTCPASCPPGQIVVSWDDWSPGYPGTSGGGCTPDPCPDAGISCSCATACEHLDHGLCCDWAGTTLYCNSCG